MNSLKKTILENTQINEEQMERFLSIQKKKGIPLRDVLIEEGAVTRDVLADLFSGRVYLPFLSLEKFKFDSEIVNLFPESIARLYQAIPLLKNGDNLIIATSEPLNIFVLDDLAVFCRSNIVFVFSPENEINQAIARLYQAGIKDSDNQIDSAAILQERQEPIEKLVDIVLAHALNRGASDIHIEPEFDCLRIRYRVDGVLQDVLKAPKINQDSILARLKTISDFDITENRIPQDGKFKVKSGDREIEFRVSSLPTTFGQKFVLHVLDKHILYEGLEGLGYSEGNAAILKSAALKPSGLILFSGPVGSGKTTTLYSLLNQLNTVAKDIVTIEDFTEYQIPGITQVLGRSNAGAVLRQDSDVVMIDQIRDAETADIVVKAAVSGKLVLAALQSEDAVSGISRLIEMGVEPFLIASSLILLCSQRLARKLCLKCRKPAQIPEDFPEKTVFGSKAKFYISQGCEHCNYSGFSGRIALSETVLIDGDIRDILIDRGSVDEIREYAVKRLRFKTLRDDAYLKAGQGLISLDEAIRITTEE
ncbi:MAG: GspE/PulE family protein [Candidatus Omnitrophica bacterium]|nr:GspE/PulE family protein [Candidatus Omnitrophota bacterium]